MCRKLIKGYQIVFIYFLSWLMLKLDILKTPQQVIEENRETFDKLAEM